MNTINTPGFIRVSGIDAKKFLHGQLTCHMDDVTAEKSILGAHCNPQGRVISLFRVFYVNDDYYLRLPRPSIAVAMTALQKYAVFFKVKLTDASEESLQFGLIDEDFAQGIAAIYPETSEKFLPHELNLVNLGAVHLNKGCYTGQEIIARMQYRGKLKKHLYHVQLESLEKPIRGNDLYTGDKCVGSIVDFVEIAYNNYELLVVAEDAEVKNGNLYLDMENKFLLSVIPAKAGIHQNRFPPSRE